MRGDADKDREEIGGERWKGERAAKMVANVARAALKRHNSNSPGSSKINQLGRYVSGY